MDKKFDTARRDWVAAWEQIEGLARDAARWYETCGDCCGIISLAEWRQRVIAQVHASLIAEHDAFVVLQEASAEAEES